MEGEAAGSEAGMGGETQDAGDYSTTTVYNGSVPCAGCNGMLTPISAAYGYAECHNCRKKRHHKHVKRGMHNGR